MLVRCQLFGDLFLFGLVWQYSSIQKNIIKVGAKSWMLTCSCHITLSLPFYADPDSKRELNFCNGYLSLLYFWFVSLKKIYEITQEKNRTSSLDVPKGPYVIKFTGISQVTSTMKTSLKTSQNKKDINFFYLHQKWCLFCSWQLRKSYTVNIYRYKAIGANATSSVILYTSKCISPYQEILQLLQVILQPLQDYLYELKDLQTGANVFTGIQNYTGCCISPYSFVPINIYSVYSINLMFLSFVASKVNV